MTNVTYIYQPHFNTKSFRVAFHEQRGTRYNYIVVTCSPLYNGVYRYEVEKTKNYPIWFNGKLPCYCVPIIDCEKIKELEDCSPDIKKIISKYQKKWLAGEVKNKRIQKNQTPDWMIKEAV